MKMKGLIGFTDRQSRMTAHSPLKAGFLDGPDALGAKVVAASLANLETYQQP